ncbi:PDDEXK nuclease domain-containing protein [uncultured Cetobacterium sp.]|uniref:PDDEXK nuclease domain-containing protein n=1 Tax=uncultured Cetobacterium sp. TaxID=527638 RepID=UPI0025D9BB27|nr:PDDEXK nuclease domain-containing protein [uncultured Cetobacterium sp.]
MLERKDNLYHDIKALLENARKKVLSTVNSTMTLTYFLIGKKIVEEEQNGELRAEYGKELIKNLATKLTKEFGKGFTVRNLELIRKFYMTYSEDEKTKSVISFSENPFKLSWTHYIRLVRIQNVEERSFYEIEAEKENWTVREMDRQISSCLYEKLVLSRDKEEVKALSTKGQIIEKPKDIIKDPYVLEFLGLEEISSYSENTLETSIINHIEKFIMELGKGFLFQGRQVRFTFDEEHFFVDLVFYNRILKCFVLIDLKIGKLKHQDIGQMQMYVNYYDRFIKLDDENKTIGIIICKDKNDTLVEITLPENNEQIFASRYMTILPSKEDLAKIVEEEERNEK